MESYSRSFRSLYYTDSKVFITSRNDFIVDDSKEDQSKKSKEPESFGNIISKKFPQLDNIN